MNSSILKNPLEELRFELLPEIGQRMKQNRFFALQIKTKSKDTVINATELTIITDFP